MHRSSTPPAQPNRYSVGQAIWGQCYWAGVRLVVRFVGRLVKDKLVLCVADREESRLWTKIEDRQSAMRVCSRRILFFYRDDRGIPLVGTFERQAEQENSQEANSENRPQDNPTTWEGC